MIIQEFIYKKIGTYGNITLNFYMKRHDLLLEGILIEVKCFILNMSLLDLGLICK